MYIRRYTRPFKKSFRKIASSGDKKILKEIEAAVEMLTQDLKLGSKYKNHNLTGELQYCQECHIRPDLLLIYQIDKEDLILIDIGSHSQLFG